MKKFMVGICGGIIGAFINVSFLFFAPDLEIEVYISTSITWIVIGILIASSSFKLNGIAKGIIISTLVSASSMVYTITSSPSGAIWTLINTILFGAIIGYGIEKACTRIEETT